jgi:hypothetical protein
MFLIHPRCPSYQLTCAVTRDVVLLQQAVDGRAKQCNRNGAPTIECDFPDQVNLIQVSSMSAGGGIPPWHISIRRDERVLSRHWAAVQFEPVTCSHWAKVMTSTLGWQWPLSLFVLSCRFVPLVRTLEVWFYASLNITAQYCVSLNGGG